MIGSRLINIDALEGLPALPGASVDLTVTSPPFDDTFTYGSKAVWNENAWRTIIAELWRVTKPGGVVAWMVLGEVLSPVQLAGAAVVFAGILLAVTARDRVVPAQPTATTWHSG